MGRNMTISQLRKYDITPGKLPRLVQSCRELIPMSVDSEAKASPTLRGRDTCGSRFLGREQMWRSLRAEIPLSGWGRIRRLAIQHFFVVTLEKAKL